MDRSRRTDLAPVVSTARCFDTPSYCIFIVMAHSDIIFLLQFEGSLVRSHAIDNSGELAWRVPADRLALGQETKGTLDCN